MQKQVKTQKSTNNPVSSFDLVEENRDVSYVLSCTDDILTNKTIDE